MGWRHFRHDTPGIQTSADFAPDAAHYGRLGLRLTVRADNPENPPAMDRDAASSGSPVPPCPSRQARSCASMAGSTCPLAITGSVDGLLVVESLTGEEMALRLDKTVGWREFTMLRIVPQSGPLSP